MPVTPSIDKTTVEARARRVAETSELLRKAAEAHSMARLSLDMATEALEKRTRDAQEALDMLIAATGGGA